MKYLDLKEANKNARETQEGTGGAIALIIMVVVAAFICTERSRSPLVGVACGACVLITCLLAYVLKTKRDHCADMLDVAREIADFDDEEEDLEEIFPGGGVTVWTFTNKTGHEIKAGTPVYCVPPAPKRKPPKCECVELEQIPGHPGWWMECESPGLHMQICGRFHTCPDGRSELLEVGTKFCPRCGKQILTDCP